MPVHHIAVCSVDVDSQILDGVIGQRFEQHDVELLASAVEEVASQSGVGDFVKKCSNVAELIGEERFWPVDILRLDGLLKSIDNVDEIANLLAENRNLIIHLGSLHELIVVVVCF